MATKVQDESTEQIVLFKNWRTQEIDPEAIKQIRSIMGWSHDRMAVEIGCSSGSIFRWERGVGKPLGGYIRALMKLTDEVNAKLRKGEL